jgi:hypothetical protein
MPLEALRKTCQTERDIFEQFLEDNFPPLPDELEELPLYPSNMAYKITVYYDSTRDFSNDDLERILTAARAQYPDRTVHLEPLNPSSLEYYSLSPFPEMERRFKGKDGYVADVEGRLYRSGSIHYTEFVRRNLAALQANAMAMATLLHAHPQGLIHPAEPDDELRKRAVYQAMGPIIGNKTFHREEGQPDQPVIYPLVEYKGMMLGCTDFSLKRRIHWAREMTPAKAVEHGERRYARDKLFGISTDETKKQLLLEAAHARHLFSPHLLDPAAIPVETNPAMILAWYSQAIAAMRKVCWLVATKQESSVAAQALYEEARVHRSAIGNPRLPRNRRTWEDLIVDLVDQRNELIVEQCPPVLAVNEMTYEISWRNEILAALMGATYDSQVDCPDSPFQNPSKFIRHLADWIGELKRKRTATLNAYTAASILELLDRDEQCERLLLSQFPRSTWAALADVSEAVSCGERPDVEVTYTWTTDPARPYGYANVGNRIALVGPLLCYPTLEADQWRENARVVLGLRGFELKRN